MLRIIFIVFTSILLFISCKEKKRIGEKEVVQQEAQINESASEIIEESLSEFLQELVENDSLSNMNNVSHIKEIYKQIDYAPVWSSNGKLTMAADSLLFTIDSAKI